MMTSPAFVPPYQPIRGLLARLAERFGYWRERRRWVGEIQNVAALDRLDTLLADVGLDRGRLGVLMTGPVDAGRQLEPMAAASGTDLHAVPPTVLRDAEWTCTVCQSHKACAHWLRTGEWSGGDPRCPNAELLRKP